MDEFKYGIEAELAVIRPDGRFADFTNTPFEELDRVIGDLPTFAGDYPGLRVGDLGIKAKRWYIEGYERFAEDGTYLRTLIKGLEVRTPICGSIDEAVRTLATDFGRLRLAAGKYGYRVVAVGLNPFADEFVPDPPLNTFEVAQRASPEEQTAFIHMLTYGPDVSISSPHWNDDDLIDIARKLTAYSPYIVPFGFSSPFWRGQRWDGLSRRVFYRNGTRPAALVFLHDPVRLLATRPTLTEPPRVAAEAGRIEFKGFDATNDPSRFGAYLALIKGIALDTTLTERQDTPDSEAHQRAAVSGFGDEAARQVTVGVLAAARAALPPAERAYLDPLQAELERRETPADVMITRYNEDPDIIKLLEADYAL